MCAPYRVLCGILFDPLTGSSREELVGERRRHGRASWIGISLCPQEGISYLVSPFLHKVPCSCLSFHVDICLTKYLYYGICFPFILRQGSLRLTEIISLPGTVYSLKNGTP